MPFCPECRDEFQDWVKVCPDCNVALVKELPPLPKKEKKKDEPLAYIASAPNEMIAGMWSDILKEQDIPCLVRRSGLKVAMYPTYDERCELYVLASKAEKAKEIIAPFLDDEGVEDIEDIIRGGK